MRINSIITALIVTAIITLIFTGCKDSHSDGPVKELTWDKIEIDLPFGNGLDQIVATTYYQAEECPETWMDGVCASPGNYQIWYRGGCMIAVGMNLVPYGGPWTNSIGVNSDGLFYRGNLIQNNDWMPAQWQEDDWGEYILFNLTDHATANWDGRWYLIHLPPDLGYEASRTYNWQLHEEFLRVIGRHDPYPPLKATETLAPSQLTRGSLRFLCLSICW